MSSPNESTTEDATLDFQRDVLEASRERPVVVDFWAPWCGPCQTLGPVIEKLADEAEGEWLLVKINTDDHPAISQQAGIRGIPAVKLYVHGELAAEFTGALPEPILRRWLEEHLPAEWKELFEDARRLLRTGNRGEAQQRLERLLELQPDNEDGRALLARIVALQDLDRARSLLEGIEHRAEAEAIRNIEVFRGVEDDPSSLPDGPARDRYVEASKLLGDKDLEGAIGALLEVIQRDRYYDDDGPRRALVALFLLLGERDPVVQKYRPIFNRSLY